MCLLRAGGDSKKLMTSTTEEKAGNTPHRDSTHPRPRDRRRPYTPPRLTVYGDVRDVTLGASPGGVESGGVPFREPGT